LTNEEFQSIVLKQLGELKEDVSGLKEDVSGLKEDVSRLKVDVTSLKVGQMRIEERLGRVEYKLDAVHDYTAVLTEFRTEANMKLDSLSDENKSIYEIIGRHEVEISTLKRKAG
jgi:regulator of replication initiation timing